jgi:hypothetical protein
MRGGNSMQYEVVVDRLYSAFPRTEIDPKGAFLPWGTTYPDAEEFERHLKGKTWDNLDKNYLALRNDALGFLGTSHLILVLPAYMLALLQGLRPLSSLPRILMIILTKPETDEGLGKERFDALIDGLTEKQRAAIAASLAYFAETHGEKAMVEAATLALDKFWDQYLDKSV